MASLPSAPTARPYALSAAEKDRVLEVVIEETNHRVPVYAGTGCITTKETIEMSKKAAAMGADVLSIITPYFAAASQDELYAHYMAVAEAVDLPIVLYNIPARTGNALSPATVAKLAKNAPISWGPRTPAETSTISSNILSRPAAWTRNSASSPAMTP